MARSARRYNAQLLLALAAVPVAVAQLTDLPDLSTATQATDLPSTESTATSDGSTAESSAASTGKTTTGKTTAASTAATTSASTTDTSATITFTGSGSTTISGLLTNAPTIAGAGIPSIGVPFTGNAPFMQKSSMPEGTVFIVVGAVLAFLGACVLLWRGLVAWSINRSVKRAALASMRGNEKSTATWGGSTGYQPVKGGVYRDNAYDGSSMSLDALTSQGKPIKPFKEADTGRSTPPSGLFFSPTEQARNSVGNLSNLGNRASSYLPAGYYASPSAQVAGGEDRTVIGGSIAPYARHSQYNPSPPISPSLPPTSRGAGVRATSLDRLRAPQSRDSTTQVGSRGSYIDRTSYYDNSRRSYLEPSPRPSTSHLGTAPSNSSLALNLPGSHLSSEVSSNPAGSRAPSAYLEDLFENHGTGPRERF